ncbi:MAG: ABC transporter substrate-binding protein [Verrucomicrobiota bacterium]
MKNMYRNIRFIGLALVSATLLLTSCSKAPQETTTVRMASQPLIFGLPLYVAQDQGIFAKNDVNVDAKSFTSANDMINALVAGQIDILPDVPLVPVVSLESQYPGRFRVFAHSLMTPEKPFDRILVKTDSTIKTLTDLSGKRVALIPGTTALNAMKAFLKKHGVDAASISFVQLAPPAQLPALQSDSVDALYAYEPLLTIALAQGRYRPISGSIYCDLLNPCPLVVSLVDRNFEKANPETTKRAINALDEATRAIQADPVKASASLATHANVPTNLTAKVNIQNRTIEGQMDLKLMQKFIDLLLEIGEVQKSASAEKMTELTH